MRGHTTGFITRLDVFPEASDLKAVMFIVPFWQFPPQKARA